MSDTQILFAVFIGYVVLVVGAVIFDPYFFHEDDGEC